MPIDERGQERFHGFNIDAFFQFKICTANRRNPQSNRDGGAILSSNRPNNGDVTKNRIARNAVNGGYRVIIFDISKA